MSERGSSFRFQDKSDQGVCNVAYDGDVVLVPLYIYKKLLKAAEKSDPDVKTIAGEYFKDPSHRGSRKGSGDLADALILADAVNGMPISEMLKKKYPHKKGGKKRYSRGKIYATLSADYDRVTELITDYPEELGYLGEKIFVWLKGRSKK